MKTERTHWKYALKRATAGLLILGVIFMTSCRKKGEDPGEEDFGGDAVFVTGFTPSTAAQGEEVTIKGVNLDVATAVSFNGTPATIISKSLTSIQVKVPTGATTGKITVSGPNGFASSPTDFNVIDPNAVAISSFTPAMGIEGDIITINGINLSNVTSVNINGTSASILSNTGLAIQVAIPSGATTGKINVISPTKNISTTTDLKIIQEYIITTFEDVAADKITNSAWWDYHDVGPDNTGNTADDDPWTLTLPATSGSYEGSNHIKFDGEDKNASYWVGGTGQNTGSASDPSFGFPNLDISDAYLNVYIKTNGMTGVDVKLRETDGDIHKQLGLTPSSAGAWDLISIPLNGSWNTSEGSGGNNIINTNLINGLVFDIVTVGGNGFVISAEVDRVTITSGGPTTK